MVTELGLLISVLLASNADLKSLFPKDSTTGWCGSVIGDAYDCFPNPWGEDNFRKWYRFRTTPGIKGCLIGEDPFFTIGTYDTLKWTSDIRYGGPVLSRFTFTYDPDCDRNWAGTIKNTALSGDSILMEFKMTPADTAVPDTIRGEMKALYLVLQDEAISRRQNPASRILWTGSLLRLPPRAYGPVLLTRMDGRGVRTATHTVLGTSTAVAPDSPLVPGLYAVRWSNGSGLVVISSH